ncbi:hypothetical protein ACFYT4_25050 [Streptomyces sp. NPDC004609]|uniref:hypothetical protein n=1 Tax=Streptomyces sp. NPDC004609 TaxID=3364704 RepID=UPI0036A5BCFB
MAGLDDDPNDPVVVTGYKATHARKLSISQKGADRARAAGRAPVERGFARLRNWRHSPRSAPTPPTPPLPAGTDTNLEVNR